MSKEQSRPIERRELGKTGHKLSVIGFGGMIVHDTTPAEAANHVAEAVDRGINYFDVAPLYGNAQERLGPALEPYREQSFLACKTRKRDRAGAAEELEESLRLLRTDHFDLYQLHSVQQIERDVERPLGPEGAIETVLAAREAGKVRLVGFSAHTEEAALAAIERFDFDTVLFPFNYATWVKGGFGHDLLAKAKEKGMGVLALKSLARAAWPEGTEAKERKWPKCWYEPWDEAEAIGLHLRFTLGLGVTAAIAPSHWELFDIALKRAEAGEGPLAPLDEAETARIDELVESATPLFAAPAL